MHPIEYHGLNIKETKEFYKRLEYIFKIQRNDILKVRDLSIFLGKLKENETKSVKKKVTYFTLFIRGLDYKDIYNGEKPELNQTNIKYIIKDNRFENNKFRITLSELYNDIFFQVPITDEIELTDTIEYAIKLVEDSISKINNSNSIKKNSLIEKLNLI